MILEEKRRNLQEVCGCYIFKNHHNHIIYIGKSKNLKSRVNQYFSKANNIKYIYGLNNFEYSKIDALVREITDFEIILTKSESDALLLECDLIKKNKPKYNSMLKKDLSFSLLQIDLQKDYPNYVMADKQLDDVLNWKFYKKSNITNAIELIADIWKLPNCNKNFSDKKNTACLRYHLKKCYAPCENKIAKEKYLEIITDSVKFFNNNSDILEKLNIELELNITKLEFEKAELLHNKIIKLKNLKNQILKTNFVLKNKSVFLFFRAFNEKQFSVFYIKNEQLLDREVFYIDDKNECFDNYLSKINMDNFSLEKSFIKLNYLIEIVADKYYFVHDNSTNLENLLEAKKNFLKNKIG